MIMMYDKIDELLTTDIIEMALVCEFHSYHSVTKDNGNLRLCVDMRRVNEAIVCETRFPSLAFYH